MPLNSQEEILWISLLTILVLVIGTATIQYQCRKLSNQIQNTIREDKVGQDDELIVSCQSKQELWEVQQSIQRKKYQSYQTMAKELESMKEIQKEVKAKLVGLQNLVNQVSERKQRERKESTTNS